MKTGSNGEIPNVSEPSQTEYAIPQSEQLNESFARIDVLRNRLTELKDAHSHLWPNIFKKQKIAWTTETNAIEGSSLSFSDTLFFLEQGLTVEGKPLKDFLDARNHAEAIDLLYQRLDDEQPITPGFLKEFNALLLSGVSHTPAIDAMGRPIQKPAHPGEYKTQPNNVILPDGSMKTYIDPIHVSTEIEKLCNWINADDVHPITKAALAHYIFVTIHPFDDGNGRGARILMNLILIKVGYPPTIISNADRTSYLDALRQGQAGQGTDQFVAFISQSLEATLKDMINDFENGG